MFLVEVGYAPLLAATAFGLLGSASIGGMLVAGWLSDRFGPRASIGVMFGLTIGGLLCLIAMTAGPAFLLLGLYVVAYGASQGSRGPVISSLCAKIFHGRGQAAIYGAVSAGMGLGAATGSWLSGIIHDLSGSYALIFGFSIVTAILAMSPFWLVRALAVRH